METIVVKVKGLNPSIEKKLKQIPVNIPYEPSLHHQECTKDILKSVYARETNTALNKLKSSMERYGTATRARLQAKLKNKQ